MQWMLIQSSDEFILMLILLRNLVQKATMLLQIQNKLFYCCKYLLFSNIPILKWLIIVSEALFSNRSHLYLIILSSGIPWDFCLELFIRNCVSRLTHECKILCPEPTAFLTALITCNENYSNSLSVAFRHFAFLKKTFRHSLLISLVYVSVLNEFRVTAFRLNSLPIFAWKCKNLYSGTAVHHVYVTNACQRPFVVGR